MGAKVELSKQTFDFIGLLLGSQIALVLAFSLGYGVQHKAKAWNDKNAHYKSLRIDINYLSREMLINPNFQEKFWLDKYEGYCLTYKHLAKQQDDIVIFKRNKTKKAEELLNKRLDEEQNY